MAKGESDTCSHQGSAYTLPKPEIGGSEIAGTILRRFGQRPTLRTRLQHLCTSGFDPGQVLTQPPDQRFPSAQQGRAQLVIPQSRSVPSQCVLQKQNSGITQVSISK